MIGIKENVYFQAAKAIGCTQGRIFIQHVLPNIVAPILIIFTINIGGVIISEASLSFLGFGLPLKVPSWGGLLAYSAHFDIKLMEYNSKYGDSYLFFLKLGNCPPYFNPFFNTVIHQLCILINSMKIFIL